MKIMLLYSCLVYVLASTWLMQVFAMQNMDHMTMNTTSSMTTMIETAEDSKNHDCCPILTTSQNDCAQHCLSQYKDSLAVAYTYTSFSIEKIPVKQYVFDHTSLHTDVVYVLSYPHRWPPYLFAWPYDSYVWSTLSLT